MSFDPDNVESAVRYTLLTTRATAVCPFHSEVTMRVGDDAAETHAFYRVKTLIKNDGSEWNHEDLIEEIARQLTDAADGVCPQCLSESHAGTATPEHEWHKNQQAA
jgi:hypothetical protein